MCYVISVMTYNCHHCALKLFIFSLQKLQSEEVGIKTETALNNDKLKLYLCASKT